MAGWDLTRFRRRQPEVVDLDRAEPIPPANVEWSQVALVGCDQADENYMNLPPLVDTSRVPHVHDVTEDDATPPTPTNGRSDVEIDSCKQNNRSDQNHQEVAVSTSVADVIVDGAVGVTPQTDIDMLRADFGPCLSCPPPKPTLMPPYKEWMQWKYSEHDDGICSWHDPASQNQFCLTNSTAVTSICGQWVMYRQPLDQGGHQWWHHETSGLWFFAATGGCLPHAKEDCFWV